MKLFRSVKRFGRRAAAPAVAAVAVVGGVIVAGDASAQYQPPDLSSLTLVIQPATLAAGALALGGTGLAAAFGLGGGFRIAKKVYSWIMNKI